MRCPNCDRLPTSVLKTERAVDEGMDNIKRRRRICRNCRKIFQTFEVVEDAFRKICPAMPKPVEEKAKRSPLKTKTNRREQE